MIYSNQPGFIALAYPITPHPSARFIRLQRFAKGEQTSAFRRAEMEMEWTDEDTEIILRTFEEEEDIEIFNRLFPDYYTDEDVDPIG